VKGYRLVRPVMLAVVVVTPPTRIVVDFELSLSIIALTSESVKNEALPR
jgi:hypothetical protein